MNLTPRHRAHHEGSPGGVNRAGGLGGYVVRVTGTAGCAPSIRFVGKIRIFRRLRKVRKRTAMIEATATELAKNFGSYREMVQREPIVIKSHGRPTAYLVSVAEFEELQRYKRLVRQSFGTADLRAVEIEAIGKGRMSSDHDRLNALLDQK
jgi:prevent-host-death family protein